jgi:DNA helicase-2/ATP-dependent DNA helicase PcrA
MPSPNRITVACAGSGKTTGIASEACANDKTRQALVTYTINGARELREKVIEQHGYVPEHIEIFTWFTFLMRHFVRPYQRAMFDARPVRRLTWVNRQSTRGIPKSATERFYFSSSTGIYSDKVSQFACDVISAAKNAPLDRIAEIYGSIHIDEAQDLAGYDLDLVELLLKSSIDLSLVGDVRQGTYKTNHSARNKQYSGAAIVGKFKEWAKADFCMLNSSSISRRCVQPICDLADQLYPDLPKATSKNETITGHEGVCAVCESDVPTYFAQYAPQPMRLDAKTRVILDGVLNYGAAKGMTFERTLLFPHGAFRKAVLMGDFAELGDAALTIAKVYVGLTRARQSVAIVVPDTSQPKLIPIWRPD